jgi:hypothetical protein
MGSGILPTFGRVQADLEDPDHATAQTISVMCGHVADSVYGESPLTRRAAVDAVRRFKGRIRGAFWWPKHEIKFVHHSKLIRRWLNEADQLQLLISPERLLAMPRLPIAGERRPTGDCAIFCMLVAALLECYGLGWQFVTLAVDPREPSLYTHVFTRAIFPDNSVYPLDASHGPGPGWQVPMNRRFREQAWSSSGEAAGNAPVFERRPM